MRQLGSGGRAILRHDWQFWANAAQLPPEGDWRFWLIMGGRGAGKTRAGAEWVRGNVEAGRCGRLALVGQSLWDVREVMVAGESGLIATAPPSLRPRYESSRRRLVWDNGAVGFAYSAEEPDSLRGPQFDAAWCDEFAAWPYDGAALKTLDMALRVGPSPRAVITTTPRANNAMRELLSMRQVALTRSATTANIANLSPGFVTGLMERYGGTTMARQELGGELVDDPPEAMFKRAWIEPYRLSPDAVPPLRRIVVAVDPPAGGGPKSDECGIVVAGVIGWGLAAKAYVLADLSLRANGPEDWARKAMQALEFYHADCIIAEANQGGEMVRTVLSLFGPAISVRLVHATRGKSHRATPVSFAYQRGQVAHVGSFPELEDQMCRLDAPLADDAGGRTNKTADDRVDALVWALWALIVEQHRNPNVRTL